MMKYLNGIITGVVVGAAIGMTVMPQLDRKTQRRIKRAGRKVIDFMGDSYENIIEII